MTNLDSIYCTYDCDVIAILSSKTGNICMEKSMNVLCGSTLLIITLRSCSIISRKVQILLEYAYVFRRNTKKCG
jgi:hypothetical protein